MRKKAPKINQLDISNLPEGLYFVTLKNSEGKMVVKKVLKR
jgi:hypothetical protein